MKMLLCVLPLLTGCDAVFGLERPPLDGNVDGDNSVNRDGYLIDATMLDVATADATITDATIDAAPIDAVLPDAPLDAWACSTHSQCLAMTPGTCCVNPGSAGYCTPGIVIAGACSPQ